MQPRLLDGRNLEVILSNVPLPEPDISVPFLSEVRKVPQGDYYRADKVLPLLKQWPVLYEAAKAGHEQAFAEAQNAAAVSAAKDKEIAALRERVRVLEDALRKACDDMEVWGLYAPEYFREKHDFVGDVEAARAALEQKP